jgi:predicted  nucleic acid-binding Zn-ribbon protein
LINKFSNQKEELTAKKGDYNKVWAKYKQTINEKQDIENEIHREIENLMNRVEELTKEIKLKDQIIDNFTPATEYMKIERTAEWRDDIKEWHIPNLEYTGNIIKINKAKKK